MYGILKKNTAQYIVFPLVDADGDFVSGATITGEFNYWEDGTAPQTSFSALTNAEVEIGSTGVYRVLLAAGETNHGYIALKFTSGTSKPQLLLFRTTTGDPLSLSVHSAADIWTAGSRALTTPADYKADVSALALEATVAALNNIAAADVWAEAVKVITGGVLTTPADYKADVTNLDQAISTTESNIRGGTETLETIKTDTSAILIDTDTMEADLKTEIDANETKIDALNNISTTQVKTEVDNALADIDLDHLIQVAAGVEKPTVDSYLDQIMNKAGTQDFDPTTDSLEAIRDRGDAEWITGGAGGIDAIINVIPSIPKNIDLSNTKTVRIALYVIDSIDDLPTTAEITPGTITIDRSADGGTLWSNVVNAAACSEHAGCIYYDEVFDSGTGYVSADMIRITFKGQKITIAANDIEIADATDGMVFTTRIDSGLSGGGPSAGDIADAVWDELIADHTGGTTFGGKNQKVVPSETINDYKASGFSTHVAADIWSVVTRALTDKTGFSISGTKQTLDALNDILASDVWSAGSRELSTPANYKADVSLLALEATIAALNNISTTEVNAEVDSALNTAIPESPVADSINERIKQIDENPNIYKATGFSTSIALTTHDGKLDTVDANVDLILEDTATTIPGLIAALNNLSSDDVGDAVWDEVLSAHVSAGSAGEEIRRLRGLNGEFIVAEYTFVSNDNTILEFWQYDTEANFNTHDKSTGKIGSWIINTTYSLTKPTIAKSKRLS